MQIMPHFSYLIPVVVFFGIGDHAGAIATIIFATPPMVRLTILGLKKVPPEVTEAGLMSGTHAMCDDFLAPANGMDYFLDFPDGNPARCNAATAPPECTSEAVENLP